MKHITMVAALVLMSLTTFAQGQSNGAATGQKATPEEQAQKMTDRMKKELALTDAQYKQVYEINLATAKRKAELEKGNQQERTMMREQHLAELNKVLTPEQQEKAKQMHESRKGKFHKHLGQGQQANPE